MRITNHSSRFIEMFGQVGDPQSHYPVKRMEECCSYISDGSHYSPTEDSQGAYPMLSVKDMTDNGFSYSDCKYIGSVDYEKLVANGCKPYKNDVLVAKDGSYFKYAFVVNEDKEQAILSSIAILRPDSEMVRPRYLAYYMLMDAVVKLVEKNYLTGTAIRRVILKGFKVLPVIVPDLESQDKFIHILEQADKSKFNGFKSRFIEMFCNGNWEQRPLGDVGSFKRGGGFQKSDYVESGIPCIHYGQIHTVFGPFIYSHITEISSDLESKTKFASKGDLIIAITSEDAEGSCKSTAWLGAYPVAVGAHAAIYNHCMNPLYMSFFFKSALFSHAKMEYIHGTKVVEIRPDDIAKILLPCPPMSLQEQFSTIAEQADKSKYLS